MVEKRTTFKGVSQLAAKTSYTAQYVSMLLSQGHSPAQIMERAAARDSGQMRPLQGRAIGSVKRRGVAQAGTKEGRVVTDPAKQGYVPGRLRGAVPTTANSTSGSTTPNVIPPSSPGHRVGLSKAELSPGRPVNRPVNRPVKKSALPKFVPTPDPVGSIDILGLNEDPDNPDNQPKENLQSATLRKEIALADQREMENEFRRGELVLRSHIANWLGTGIVTARDWLRRIPQELRDQIAIENDPVRCEEIMQRSIDEVLGRVADYFREMVGEVTEDGEKAA